MAFERAPGAKNRDKELRKPDNLAIKFASGFPFGHDHWSSGAATAYAAQAFAAGLSGEVVWDQNTRKPYPGSGSGTEMFDAWQIHLIT